MKTVVSLKELDLQTDATPTKAPEAANTNGKSEKSEEKRLKEKNRILSRLNGQQRRLGSPGKIVLTEETCETGGAHREQI